MLEKKVKEKSTTLFRQRVKDAEQFWQRLSEDKRRFLLGTSMLVDGDFENGINLYNKINTSFAMTYNLLTAYKMHGKNQQHENLKIEIFRNYESEFEKSKQTSINKKVAFFLSYLGNTGAMKMLLLHKKWLEEDGYEVTLFVPYSDKGLVFDYELFEQKLKLQTYSNDKELRKIASKFDIAVAPHWDYLFPLFLNFKKVFFFSQGDYDVFSESPDAINLLRKFYWLPNHQFTVSNFLKEQIKRKQFRNPSIIPCGLDISVFHPGEKYNKTTVLVVGSAGAEQKRISETLTYLLLLKERYDFDIIWINPQENVTKLEGVNVVNAPNQDELRSLFRKSHIFVSGSEIESFSLPPLEAMASGTVVVAANNGGILEYAEDQKNILLFERNNWGQMVAILEDLLNNRYNADTLISNGLATSERFEINQIKSRFTDYINNCINYTFYKG